MVVWEIDLWTVFITVFILVFLTFLFVLFQLYFVPNDDDFRSSKYSKIKSKLRTGDLLIVSYPSYRGKLVKIFTGSSWTHCGMVMKKRGKYYVIEIARYTRDERGLILKPLDDWIEWNSDYIISLRKYNGEKKFPKKKLQNLLKESEYYEEDLSVVSWLKTTIRRRYYPEDKDYYYCSEFLAYTMQKIGIMKRIVIPSSFKPWELLYSKLPMYDGYSYVNSPVILDL